MKVTKKTTMPDGTSIQIEDWSANYPNIHMPCDQLAAYPVSKQTVWHKTKIGGGYDYPTRGQKFRLGMHFPTTEEAERAYNDLAEGKTVLENYVEYFDTMPNTSAEQFKECVK